MTTTQTSITDIVAQATAAAEQASEDLLQGHRRNYAAPGAQCHCGRGFRRSQDLGNHLARVKRAADRAWTETYDRVSEELRAASGRRW